MLRRALQALAGFLSIIGSNAAMAAAGSAVGAGSNWLSHDGDVDQTSYSRLHQIDASDIQRLGLAWSLALPGAVTLEATPLAVGGVLYFTDSYAIVYAVDGRRGRLLWKYDPQTWRYFPGKMMFNFAANRGVAYAQIGNTGADFGARGYVTAYDQKTGREAWRFYTAPGSPEQNRGHPELERAAKTWSGEYWKVGTGGGVWDSITFDPQLHRIYLGTANAGPYDPEIRSPGGGDNLYTASSSRSMPAPAGMSGITRSIRAMPGIMTARSR